MARRWRAGPAGLALLLLWGGAGSARSDGEPRLAINVVGVQRNLGLAELAALPVRRVHATSDKGIPAEYQCVDLREILRGADVVEGKALSGTHLLSYVLAEGSDGYQALFSLAELDPLLGNHSPLVCFARDGAPLPTEEGPLRLVTEAESRHARWVRHLRRISVGRLDART